LHSFLSFVGMYIYMVRYAVLYPMDEDTYTVCVMLGCIQFDVLFPSSCTCLYQLYLSAVSVNQDMYDRSCNACCLCRNVPGVSFCSNITELT
jgi:hypothetical protein